MCQVDAASLTLLQKTYSVEGVNEFLSRFSEAGRHLALCISPPVETVFFVDRNDGSTVSCLEVPPLLRQGNHFMTPGQSVLVLKSGVPCCLPCGRSRASGSRTRGSERATQLCDSLLLRKWLEEDKGIKSVFSYQMVLFSSSLATVLISF